MERKAQFLKVSGKLGIGIAIVGLLINVADQPVKALTGGFFGVVNGIALIILGRTIQNVDYLKKKLNVSLPSEVGSQLLQTTCFECGYRFDYNSHKCPSCGSSKEQSKV
ncbi:hypothetical protein RH915_10210 [Serpentinicella sp. ANB-PHB4]|uniref:hypothetical protein n=1 Tax=Serpentinicella sp. ANB-PHB4 TaxID=3074076 RepID=UPI0028542033|nr:hypothetical protein [Serpentinicella sp. ANB-PHB4]MDR5659862.1 hypothetical protein [Serpentinicella sp. ANB-PHB4]